MYSRLQKKWATEEGTHYRCTTQWNFTARGDWEINAHVPKPCVIASVPTQSTQELTLF
jgi:hypothetical protein